jgi:hypothetical protein
VLLFTRITADGSYLTQVLRPRWCSPWARDCACRRSATPRCTGHEQDAGLASGVQQALQQVGGAVGLAVLVTFALRAAEEAVRSGTDPAVAITDGYVLALQVGAGVLAVATALAAGLLRPGVGRGTAVAAGAH